MISEAMWLTIMEFGIKFGLDSAIALLTGVKTAKTIDDAIVALQLAKTKSAQQYLDEAKPK